MNIIKDSYTVRYNDKVIGNYCVFDDDTVSFCTSWGSPWDIGEELAALGLDKKKEHIRSIKALAVLINDSKRVPGRKRVIYRDGPLSLERRPRQTDERYSVYRRGADEGDPDYSPLPHDAPHREGPNTPKDMREWASWYAFNKMDDGTYEAELDEAWWWGGGHNDGGTMHSEIPEEWFTLPYDDFLCNVVRLSAAAHYGFTPQMLKRKPGLREFFGFE